jgi:4-amino-4-deoxy-L-arabinose transferase-like glycosyltransferase
VTRAEKPGPWWLTAVFAVALATRLLWITVPINVDEGLWMQRGPAFLRAVLLNRPAGTYQRHHPGVTNMWLIGGAVASRYLLRDILPPDDPARQASSLTSYLRAVAGAPVVPLTLHVQARIVAGFMTAACMVGIFALSWRLFGATVALIATAILLLEPFFLGYQRFVTTDANQTNFTWLALLTFLVYLGAVGAKKSRALGWSLLAGLFFGLALLSKVSAVLSLPAFVLAAVWWGWRLRSTKAALQLALGVLAWASAAVVVTFVLWPALWADPTGTFLRLLRDVGYETDGHIQFFLGHTLTKPGLLFYPVVLVYRLSPLLLLGALLGLVSLALPSLRRHLRDSASLTVIVLDLVVVLLVLSIVGSKLDRYIVPLVPGMALVAASGISAVMCHLVTTRIGDGSTKSARARLALSRPGVVLPLLILAQLAILLPHVPYYVTYFNPLAGGPALAQRLLMVGNGELMDRAALWLAQQTQARDATVVTWYVESLGPYRDGLTVGLGDRPADEPEVWRRANFAVLYINMTQRNWPAQAVEYFSYQRPLYEVKAHGVTYVQVYPGPSVRDADLATIANRVDLDFGGNARLIGYDLETPEVSAGESATLTLFWQALGPFPARDFILHLGIKDGNGNEWGEVNHVPVGGMLPVYEWEPGQILRDAHRVVVPPGTPPGKYALTVSWWSPTLARALDVSDRGTPAGNGAALTELGVTQPARPPDPATDLQIANRLEDEVRVAPGAARLVGYQWPQLATVRAGDAIPLTLLWQAGAGEAADAQLLLRLSQGELQWQRAVGHLLGGDYAPENWTAGELVRDTWNAVLPADVPPGRHQLALVARTSAGDKVLLSLGPVEVLVRDHEFNQPSPRFTQEAGLRSPASLAGGDMVRLVGYALPDAIQAGQVLPVTLYWEALGEAERSYARFVHVLDANDRIVAQQDGVPGKGDLPVTSWLVGEYVKDDVEIALPAELAPGSYRLAVGLYDPANGRRLTAGDAQERILLTRGLEVR